MTADKHRRMKSHDQNPRAHSTCPLPKHLGPRFAFQHRFEADTDNRSRIQGE